MFSKIVSAIGVGVLTCFFCATTYASSLSLQSTQTALHVGDVFYIDVLLDTESQIVNAGETTLVFPSNIVSYVKSSEKDSSVTFWIQKPEEITGGKITFSGVTPGGLEGERLLLTRLYFEVQTEGQGVFEALEAAFLLHDGQGTPTEVTTNNLHISVTPGTNTLVERPYVDDELPEPFTPLLLTDSDVFDGASMLVFETQDKNAGILKYQVKEGIFARYTDAESPYRIKHQVLDREIKVKAIDKAGNERIAIVYPQNGYVWHQKPVVIFSILIVIVSLCSLFFIYKLFRGRKSRV